MKVIRSYSISLGALQKDLILQILRERDEAEKWSEDILFTQIEQLLLCAFELGMRERMKCPD